MLIGSIPNVVGKDITYI